MNAARLYNARLVAQYELLLDNYEFQPDNHSKRALEEFLKENPGVREFDSNGNWVGPVSGEDGWTQ